MAKRHKSSRTNRKKNQKLVSQTSKPMTETLPLAHDNHEIHEDIQDIHEETSSALQDKFISNRNTSDSGADADADMKIEQAENKNHHQSSDLDSNSDETSTVTAKTAHQNHEQHETKQNVLSENTSSISIATATTQTANPLDYSGEQEYRLEDEPKASSSSQSVYSLDAHYDAPTSSESETSSFQTQSVESTLPPTLAEYEQLKRKNRRRLVGAGALVLVAGSLFAASSNSKNETAPTLHSTNKQLETPIEPDILYPSGASRPVVAQFNLDDSKNAPIKNISEKRTKTSNTQNSSQSTQTQQVAKPKTSESVNATATARKNNNSNNMNNNGNNAVVHSATSNSNTNNTNNNTVANNTEKRRESENAERLKKAQAVTAKVEQERLNKEKTTASNARAAQLAADKARNEARAKLEQNQKVQLPSERAATEKQRAQRQAAEREKASTKNTASPSNQQRAIQAGAFTDKASAQRRQQQLRDLNLSARLEEVKTNKGTIYRVKTGAFSNAEQAEQALNRLQNKGVNGIVVGK